MKVKKPKKKGKKVKRSTTMTEDEVIQQLEKAIADYEVCVRMQNTKT